MIKIIAIGKIKERYLIDAIEDYKKRISKYHKIEVIELKDSNIIDEEKEILSIINSNDYTILMDINSKEYSSLELSDKINKYFIDSNSKLVFIIGGSEGVTDKIKEAVNERISFSKLTFPHGIFRLILLEQIYRCFKIINNETYHK